MISLAQQIKDLRTAHHLSQDDLAEKLYISRQSISKWENSEAIPDLEKLVQLAEIFDVSLDYLILGQEPEKEIVIEQQGKMNFWEYLDVGRQQKTPFFDGLSIVIIVFLVLLGFVGIAYLAGKI